MDAENDSKVQVEEQEHLFTQVPVSIVKKADDEHKISNLQNNSIKEDVLLENNVVLDEHATISNNGNIEIHVWGETKIYINKTLILLRIAQFLWYASGSLCSPFVSLFLINRGLILIEFSTVLSTMFVFQLKVAYICGIIVDKLGNSKPVLLFVMIGATFSVIGLLLSPNIRDHSCLEKNINVICYNIFNDTSDLEYCEYICPTFETGYFIREIENDNNGSIAYSNGTNFQRKNGTLEDLYNLNNSLNVCSVLCSCIDQSAKNCSSIAKVGFKILYSVLILSFFSFWSVSYSFLDYTSLNVAKKYNSDFGRERLFGLLGALVATMLCNFVLHIDQSQSYDNVFWFSFVLCIIAIITAYNIRDVMIPPGLNFTKNSLKLFTDVEITSIICVAFVAGSAYTFNSFFQLYFLDSLKASKTVLGLHIITSPLYSLPIYVTSKWWIRKLGKKRILVISLFGYSINAICYSFLYYPWLSLIIEITKAFSFHLFVVASTIHCREIAPKGFSATVIAIVGTVHSGFGRTFSVSVGGYLISTLGARATFKILGCFCLVAAVLYSIFLYLRHLFSKKNSKNRVTDTEEMKSMRENEC